MDTANYIHVTMPSTDNMLVRMFKDAINGDEIMAQYHFLVNIDTEVAWMFDPDTISPEQIMWVDANYTREGLGMPDTPSSIVTEVRDYWANTGYGDSLDARSHIVEQRRRMTAYEFSQYKLTDEYNHLMELQASYEKVRVAKYAYQERVSGMSEEEYAEFSQTEEYAELTEHRFFPYIPVYIYDQEHGFGPRVDMTGEILAEYIAQNRPAVIDRVSPRDLEEPRENFPDEHSGNKLYSGEFIVIEIDGQTYAVLDQERTNLSFERNPEYDPLPEHSGLHGYLRRTGGYERLKLTSDTLYSIRDYYNHYIRDVKEYITYHPGEFSSMEKNIHEGGPMGIYFELDRGIDPRDLFFVREITDPQAFLSNVANVFEERGLPYPADLLLGREDSAALEPATPDAASDRDYPILNTAVPS